MNTRNKVSLTGFYPKSEKITITYHKGDDTKKSFMFGKISVRRKFKNKETGKYDYDLIPFKAWGQKADFINDYVKRGSIIQLEGSLQMGENRPAEDGSVIYGQLEFLVEEVDIISSVDAGEGTGTQTAPTATSNVRAGLTTSPRTTPATRGGQSVFQQRRKAAASHNVL